MSEKSIFGGTLNGPDELLRATTKNKCTISLTKPSANYLSKLFSYLTIKTNCTHTVLTVDG